MDNRTIEYSDDEISLVDILRIIWRYRKFIIIFCIVICVLSFFVFYSADYIKFLKYLSINIKLPTISYALYKNIEYFLNYDLNTKMIEKEFNIKKIEIWSPDIKQNDKIIKPPYPIGKFPVSWLQLRITTLGQITDQQKSNFEKYVKNIVFKSLVLDTIDFLKEPLNKYNPVIMSTSESYPEINLFFQDLTQTFDFYFKTKKDYDLKKDYEFIYKYIMNIKADSSYLKYAQTVFANIISRQYILIDSLELKSKEEEEVVSNKKDVLIKSIKNTVIAGFASLFFAMFLVFIIDFLKKNWKDIVKEVKE